MKIVFIVGLPGAGKTEMIKNKDHAFLKSEIIEFDDILGCYYTGKDREDIRNATEFSKLVSSLKEGRTCCVADIQFCDRRKLINAEVAIKGAVEGRIEIAWVYFENEPEQCRKNATGRALKCKKREACLPTELANIEYYSKLYVIPDGVIPRPVYRPPIC
jgi:hypothetical protein